MGLTAAGGEANDHPVIFAHYAASDAWTGVHLGQFVAMATLLAGVIALCSELEGQLGRGNWSTRLGGAFATAALALYGALQAVDGVALKHAVSAWVSAPDAEKATRFASAETIRWLEWGMRSYQNFALGIALVFVAIAIVKAAWVPRPMGWLIGLSGVTYLAQGRVGGSDGFSPEHTDAIVLGFVLDVVWMTWLAIIAWRRDVALFSTDAV